jgi:GDP-L-fucose synthase
VDLADAAVFLMERYDTPEIINVGVGEDISISELARLIADVVGFNGRILFDTTKPTAHRLGCLTSHGCEPWAGK